MWMVSLGCAVIVVGASVVAVVVPKADALCCCGGACGDEGRGWGGRGEDVVVSVSRSWEDAVDHAVGGRAAMVAVVGRRLAVQLTTLRCGSQTARELECSQDSWVLCYLTPRESLSGVI